MKSDRVKLPGEKDSSTTWSVPSVACPGKKKKGKKRAERQKDSGNIHSLQPSTAGRFCDLLRVAVYLPENHTETFVVDHLIILHGCEACNIGWKVVRMYSGAYCRLTTALVNIFNWDCNLTRGTVCGGQHRDINVTYFARAHANCDTRIMPASDKRPGSTTILHGLCLQHKLSSDKDRGFR